MADVTAEKYACLFKDLHDKNRKENYDKFEILILLFLLFFQLSI